MNYEETKKSIEVAYAMINDAPTDRLDCIGKALRLLTVLNGGAIFLNEIATSPHVEDFTMEDLQYIHESFCDSAVPLVKMIEFFSERMEKATEAASFAV